MKNILGLLVSSKFDIKSSLRLSKYYGQIEESGLFDKDFYNKTYDDFSGD